MGVYLMGMHLTGVHLIGVHLIGVYLMGVQQNEKRRLTWFPAYPPISIRLLLACHGLFGAMIGRIAIPRMRLLLGRML
jgi:hypothetical protein